MAGGLVLRRVRIGSRQADVRVSAAAVEAVAPTIAPRPGDEVLDGGGGELLPGLHDHHTHLLALATALRSLRLGPPEVTNVDTFSLAVRRADVALEAGVWLRGIGYDDSVAGSLNRWQLDALVAHRPARVQHRSGALWTYNSAALYELAADTLPAPGVERDASGVATGRVFGMDEWLGRRPRIAPGELAPVGALLARYGVTGVTDATPFAWPDDAIVLAAAVAHGGLPQRVTVTGGPAMAGLVVPSELGTGPVKVMLIDPELPRLDEVIGWFVAARRYDRPVAVHCATLAALGLALAAWDTVGSRPGDRIEHANVVSSDLAELIHRHRITVVVQPGLPAEGDNNGRGRHLSPYQILLERGVRVGGGTDAPFGHPDPWRAIAAAVNRRPPTGHPHDSNTRPRDALDLFLSPLDRPGANPRTVGVGYPPDLCLLDAPLDDVLAKPSSGRVAATICRGQLVYLR